MLFFVVWTFYYRVIRVWKKDFPWVTFQRMLLLIAVQVIIAKKNLKVGNTFQAISKHSNQHGTTCINTHRCYDVELLRFDYKECWWSFIWLYLQGFVFQCEYLWYIGYNSKYITKKININQFGCPYPRIVYLPRLGFYQCTWMEHLTDMIHTIWMCRSICHTHKY